MKFEWWRDPTTNNHEVRIILTDEDMINAYPILMKDHWIEYHYFTRPGTSIEEKLMLLQLYARVLEERELNENQKNLESSKISYSNE